MCYTVLYCVIMCYNVLFKIQIQALFFPREITVQQLQYKVGR